MKTTSLKKYAREGLNVIITGKHGVGKTAVIKEVFEDVFGEYYTNWRYFSASTLDPWVDFIGIPKSTTTAEGKEVFKILPPENFTGEENVQAIFFDELNRSDTKTLNAIMELIQFKSINGRVYPNLKCVWAAENPANDEEEYSVKELDPAQKDRFHVQLTMPYDLNTSYFEGKYGKDITRVAKNWWSSKKQKISPRKLDHVLTAHMKGFDIQDFSNQINLKELATGLESIGVLAIARDVAATGSPEQIKAYFTVDMLRSKAALFKDQSDLIKSIIPHLDGETLEFVNRTLAPNTRRLDSKKMPDSLKTLVKNFASTPYFSYANISDYSQQFSEIHESNLFYALDVGDQFTKIFPFRFDTSLNTYRIRNIVQSFITTGTVGDFVVTVNTLHDLLASISDQKVRTRMADQYTRIMIKLAGCKDFRTKFKTDVDYLKLLSAQRWNDSYVVPGKVIIQEQV